MRAAGLDVTIFEKADNVGSAWRRHYDRLHLHTDRKHSGLPGMAMPKNYPLYPSRMEMVKYLETYAARFDIHPVFATEVSSLRYDGTRWCATTANGAVAAPVAVVATGIAGSPYRPAWPGMETYRGITAHSSDYGNPGPYLGKRVLVVGFGNSGGEIALDLAEVGVDVALAVRGPVQILPRDLLGLPILTWAIMYQHLPTRFVDLVNAPILRLALGSMEELGLRRATKGPRQMIEEDGRVPLIDIGTLGRIRTVRSRYAAASIALRPMASYSQMGGPKISTPSFWRPVSAPTCDRSCPMWMACSMTRGCRLRSVARQQPPGSISAARSLRRRDNCARSAWRRNALQLSHDPASQPNGAVGRMTPLCDCNTYVM